MPATEGCMWPSATGTMRGSRVPGTMRGPRARASPVTLAAVRDVRSFVGTIATNIGSTAAGLRTGFGIGSIARSVVSTRSVARSVVSPGSVAGPAAGIKNLLAAVATEIALATPIAGALAMVDARLPSVAGAADGMGRAVSRWADVDVIAATTPVDVAAPIAARPPVAERVTGAEGKPRGEQAISDIGRWRPVIGWIVRIGPGAIDHGRIDVGHINGIRIGRRNRDDVFALDLVDRNGLLFRRRQLVVSLRFCAQPLDGVHHVGLLIDNRVAKLLRPI